MAAAGATRYGAGRAWLGDQPTVELVDHDTRRRLRIALHGAVVLGFEVPFAGAVRDLADGHRDAAGIAARPGSRFAIMAPFAGRVADAGYHFDGEAYDLQPGVTGSARAARHGFVRDEDFRVVSLEADGQAARVVLGTTIDPQPGYPHVIELCVTYRLDAGGFTLEAVMRNAGDRVAPCFFGWHPYFRVADGLVDGWELQVPADTLIRTGADLIALPGVEAFVALGDVPALDFREPGLIGDRILDQGYADLQADADGRIRTRLRDPASGFGMAVWQERGVMHVFTADTLDHGARRSVALEPMECMADAFNRPDCAAAIRLEPGAERIFRCGVETDS